MMNKSYTYITLFLLFFAGTLFQQPVSAMGALLDGLGTAATETVKFAGDAGSLAVYKFNESQARLDVIRANLSKVQTELDKDPDDRIDLNLPDPDSMRVKINGTDYTAAQAWGTFGMKYAGSSFGPTQQKIYPKEGFERYRKELEKLEKIEEKTQKQKDMVTDALAEGTSSFIKGTLGKMGQKDHEIALAGERALMGAMGSELGKTKSNIAKAELEDKRYRDMLSAKSFAKYTAGLGGIAAAVYLAKHGVPMLLKPRPDVIKATSKKSWWESLMGKKSPASRLHEAVFNATLQDQMNKLLEQIKRSLKNGYPFRNQMFYGPPGTGKTMIAMELALHAGMEYIVIVGADLEQLPVEEAIKQLKQVIAYARNSTKPVLIFFDEADAVFPPRNSPRSNEKTLKLTNTFLGEVPKPTDEQLMVIFATNRPDSIDAAILSRIGGKVFFGAPDQASREKMIKIYLDKYFTKENFKLSPEVISHISQLAQMSNGFVGRKIEDTVYSMRDVMFDNVADELTFEMAKQAIQRELDSQKQQQEYDYGSVSALTA